MPHTALYIFLGNQSICLLVCSPFFAWLFSSGFRDCRGGAADRADETFKCNFLYEKSIYTSPFIECVMETLGHFALGVSSRALTQYTELYTSLHRPPYEFTQFSSVQFG